MTVPVAAEGVSARPTGRQQRTLYVYMIRSTSSPGAVNASATRSSMTITAPSSATSPRSDRSTSTGCDMSWTASKTVTSW